MKESCNYLNCHKKQESLLYYRLFLRAKTDAIHCGGRMQVCSGTEYFKKDGKIQTVRV